MIMSIEITDKAFHYQIKTNFNIFFIFLYNPIYYQGIRPTLFTKLCSKILEYFREQ